MAARRVRTMTVHDIFNIIAFQLPGAPPPWTDPPSPIGSNSNRVLIFAVPTILIMVGSLVVIMTRKRTIFIATDSARVRRRERRIRRRIQKITGDHDALMASSATLSQRIAEAPPESSQQLKSLIQDLHKIEKIRFEMNSNAAVS